MNHAHTTLQVTDPWLGQFLLQPLTTPYPVELPKRWTHCTLGAFSLRVCPSVPLVQATSGDTHAVMLGHAFDTAELAAPKETLAQIAAAPSTVETLAGRYVIFLQNASELRIVADPTVSFKVVWGQDLSDQIQIASDLKLLARSKGFRENTSPKWAWAKRQPRFKRLGGYPIHETPLHGVEPLPANHILTLDGASQCTLQRVFPWRQKVKRREREVRDLVYQQLSNVFQNAHAQGLDLWFPITSGQDSRFIAAAAHKAHIDGKLPSPPRFYFIEKEQLSASQTVDLAHVNFLRARGVNIEIFKTRSQTELRASDPPYFPLAHHSFLSHLTFNLALNEEMAFPASRLFAMANTAELIKNMHDAGPLRSAEDAARSVNYPNHPFTVAHFERWLKQAQPHAAKYGYEVHELLWWESILTHFSANMIHAGNAQVPMWCPLNSYQFNELGLSLPLADRDHYTSTLFRNATAAWWPLLDEFPLNPDRRTRSIIALKRLGLYRLYRPLGMRYRWWKSGRNQRRRETENVK